MNRTVTLRDANQGFAKLVREVEGGEEFVITRNGVPVARLTPLLGARTLTAEQQAARERTLERMVTGWRIGATALDRDALHER